MSADEDRIRHLLKTVNPPASPIAFQEIEQRVRHRRAVAWSSAASVGSVLAVVGLVVAVQARHGDSSPASQQSGLTRATPSPTATTPLPAGVVPWIDTPAPDPLSYKPHTAPSTATPSTTGTSVAARPCRTADLTTPVLTEVNGYSQHWSATLTVRNVSTVACSLTGSVQVTAIVAGLPDLTAGRATPVQMGLPPDSIAPGTEAQLLIDAPESCKAYGGGGGPTSSYDHLRIGLPQGGGSLTFAATVPTFGCGFETGTFYISPPPAVDPHDPISDLKITLQVPSNITAGTQFTYLATFVNPTSETIYLTPCPGYLQLADRGTPNPNSPSTAIVKQSYALNCAPVGTLRPTQMARFEMRMTIPADTTPGTIRIGWSLGVVSSNAATATTTVAPPTSQHS